MAVGFEQKDEEWFEYKTQSGHTVIGRIDAVMNSGSIVEHKTTSGPIDGSYFLRLEMDEQIPTYMIARNSNNVLYTVCSTPSIRQKKGETEEEFKQRCIEWLNEPDKFTIANIARLDYDLKAFADEQDAIINEMEKCKLFYRNPGHCMKWGRLCQYAPICMRYNPDEEYIQFTKTRKD